MPATFATIDDYIASYPEEVQTILQGVRRAIRAAVPEPGETISYQMPTITMDGSALVYFAAWKHHIGMYPIPGADGQLERDLAPYRGAKDAVKFAYRNPIPYELIERVTELLVARRRSAAD